MQNINSLEIAEQILDNVISNVANTTTDQKTKSASIHTATELRKNLFKQFIETINPIDFEEWQEAGYVGKILCVGKVNIH